MAWSYKHKRNLQRLQPHASVRLVTVIRGPKDHMNIQVT